ncbi:hypothetical protein [Rhizobacter sp. LjRoot28]|jgi:hypothetical protein|uniref:hypothetical protein n=1 Tax=Rhizobacter sp. LjRoot28 TaxID=3342309 RepID=UPI003ECED386
MTFGRSHAALVAEYQSLMDEERVLWNVIVGELQGLAEGTASEQAAEADMRRWAEVRERRAQLDQVFDALTRSRQSAA